MSTDEWIVKAAEQAEAERQAAMAAKGMKPFFEICEGVSEFEVDRSVPPEKRQLKHGASRILTLLNPADHVLPCTNYLFGVIVEQLAKQSHGRLKVMRTGKSTDTVYKCLPRD